jgi:hypothetical protein
MSEREIFTTLDDQGLRNLRHRLAYKEDGHFASCPHCSELFTYENLVGLYCQRVGYIFTDHGLNGMTSSVDAAPIP